MKRRLVAILTSVMMCAALLSGCGSSSKSASESAAASEKTSETQVSETAPVSEKTSEAQTSEAEPAEKYVIGVCWYSQSAQFMATCRAYMDQYVESNYADSITLIHMDGEADSATQLSQVDNLIAQEVDMILLNPNDSQQLSSAATSAKKAGIPLIEFNVQTTNSEDRITYVGSDHKISALMTATAMCEALGGEGKIINIIGPTGHEAQISRDEGLQEVLAEYPKVEIIAEKVCNWDTTQAMEAVENVIQSGMEFDAVFAQNDEMAKGAIEALKGTDLEGKVIVTGIDGMDFAIDYVKDGKQLCTAFQYAKGQAIGSIEAALAYLREEELESYIDVPFILAYDNDEFTEKFAEEKGWDIRHADDAIFDTSDVQLK